MYYYQSQNIGSAVFQGSAKRMEDANHQMITNMFDLVDKDKSGTLEKEEIAEVMAHLNRGIQPCDDKVNKCFTEMISQNFFVALVARILLVI